MSLTTQYGWDIPDVGADENTWGGLVRTLWTDLDTLLGGVNATEFAILDGATVSTAELNKLAGLATTAAELGYVSGVTSAIQTQLNTLTSDVAGKQASDATLTALAAVLTAANKVPYATALDTAGELDLQTTLTDSDTSLPTSGAVVDYVAANASSSKALLATISTASGSTASATSLDFSPYTSLEFVVNGVGLNAQGYLGMQFGSGTVLQISGDLVANNDEFYGHIFTHLSTGVFSSTLVRSGDATTPTSGAGTATSYAGSFGDVSSETSVTFDPDASYSFDGGEILVYGIV